MSYRVLEPTEQLAPTAWMGNSRSARTTAAGARPKNVTPSSVNATWATIGRSVSARMASTACCISTGSEKVSTTKASTPPSSSPSACSKKAARASSGSTEPSGARYRPSGPMEPSTKTSRPMLSRTSRASRAPLRLISRTRPADPCIAELEAVRPEGVGLDAVRAGLDVLGVDALDDLRIGLIQHVEAGVEGQPRARRASSPWRRRRGGDAR